MPPKRGKKVDAQEEKERSKKTKSDPMVGGHQRFVLSPFISLFIEGFPQICINVHEMASVCH